MDGDPTPRSTDAPASVSTFDIRPNEGVGPIALGMLRDEVHTALGSPEGPPRGGREGFLGGFFVDFDTNGRVEFIELARSSRFRAIFHGTCLHEVPADEAVRIVGEYDQCDITNPELGYSYIFLRLQLSLWRGTRPGPNQAANDSDGGYFEAVGVGADGYFQKGG
jgi:hypothetical protein